MFCASSIAKVLRQVYITQQIPDFPETNRALRTINPRTGSMG